MVGWGDSQVPTQITPREWGVTAETGGKRLGNADKGSATGGEELPTKENQTRTSK